MSSNDLPKLSNEQKFTDSGRRFQRLINLLLKNATKTFVQWPVWYVASKTTCLL